MAHANNGFKQLEDEHVYQDAIFVFNKLQSLVHPSINLPDVQDKIIFE